MLNETDLRTRRTKVAEILRRAGEAAKKRFTERNFDIQSKGVQDFVSQVDHETEQFIRAEIGKCFPDDSIMGEEGGGHLGPVTWIIDPIDGTSNFVRGLGQWCLSAGLVVNHQAVVGVIFDPMLDEMFTSHLGGGFTLNDSALQVSRADTAQSALLGLSFNFENAQGVVSQVVDQLISNGTSFRMLGAGALSLAYVAAGRTDGFWEAFMKPWDAAAGLALVSEAGGVICDYRLNEGFARGNPVLVSNPSLAEYFSDVTKVALSDHGRPKA